MRNEYDVYGFKSREDDPYTFDWLGATVNVKVLGKWCTGKVRTVDSIEHLLTVEFRDSTKLIGVTCSHQAVRRL